MAAYIQDTESQLYFSAAERWVKELEQASEFDCGSSAILAAVKAKLPHVQVVLFFSGQPAIRFPLKEWASKASFDSATSSDIQHSL